MTFRLRYRIYLTLLPMLLLLCALGVAGVVLLSRLGGRIDEILRENYASVIAMEKLKEALERIDSSFQFALIARGGGNLNEKKDLELRANDDFRKHWVDYGKALQQEKDNVTIHPQEDGLVDRLVQLTDRYRSQGQRFYQLPAQDQARFEMYVSANGLQETFTQIKGTADAILHLNQDNMESSNKAAKRLARTSVLWFGGGLVLVAVLGAFSAWYTVRTILRPITAVTEAAMGISAGNLDQVVPYLARDELGQLAQAFNTMTRHLREYRRSNYSRLLRAQRTSQATIDSFPDPVLVVDEEGQVEMANPAAIRLLGVAPAEGDKMPAARWHPPESLRPPLEQALRGQRDYLPEGFHQAVQMGSDGHEQSFLPRILTIRDPYGNTLGAAVLLQDVTRFRLLDQVKNDLVATVSHELKTPLTSLRLDLHLLLEESVGAVNAKQTELLLDARENAERLLAIVNNLLNLARLEQRRELLDLRPQSPAELLQHAADAIRPRAEDKGVTVKVDGALDLPPVFADAQRLGFALGNLLDNAISYTPRAGQITLAAVASGDQVIITIADTGTGIPPEHLPRIFERFFRVPGQSTGAGTGLGLAIVREIVTAHDGTITCTSQPGVGTTFTLVLPVWKADKLGGTL
jgi:two-component system, NtrC family, sensor histidine kinase KinB